jgi:transglutaminase/protease-like cytokinesis protein 3
MKSLTAFLVCFWAIVSLSAQTEYEKADAFAKQFKSDYTDASDLARQLTAHFSTDREKARVIFAWVAANVRYDYKKYKDPPPGPHFRARTKAEIEQQSLEWEEKSIETTLRSKKGVCEDYSRLVQKMCEATGLESVIVTGISQSMRGRKGRHAWNAIKFDGKWNLVDATWGAGVVDEEEEHFIARYAPLYFATPPSLFIFRHLPDDEKWQLLEHPVSKEEFSHQPRVNFADEDYPIEAFTPENGKIVPVNGKGEIRLKFSKTPHVFVVASGKSHEVPAEVKTGNEGWVTLTFSMGGAAEYSVYVGKSRDKTKKIAEFRVE